MTWKPHLARIVTRVIRLDRLVHVFLALGLLLNLALFAYVGWHYRALPESLSLHFDILGQPDRFGVRSEIFKLPAIGLLVLVLNSLFGLAIDRCQLEGCELGAYLLLGVATVVQVLFWLAALNIMG
jgi:uncharacterized membrane protein